jgi:two-component sensor histidine kinase
MATKSFGYIARSIRVDPPLTECIYRTALAVLIPTLVRWIIDAGEMGAAFVLYFPAIQMITTLLGWRSGAATAIASGLVVWFVFLPPRFTFELGIEQFVPLALYTSSSVMMVLVGQLLRNTLFELQARAQQSEDFNHELQHRTKNSLQMMRALASQASRATDPAEFYEMLGGRLGALAKANELLRFGALKSCEIGDLINAAIAPFAHDRFELSGPARAVSRNACTPLMMALHELATNASKYGALSAPGGKVRIAWDEGADGQLRLFWQEVGGPPVSEPTHKGMGSRLLRPSSGMRAVDLRFLPDGVTCEMMVAGV